MRQVFIFFFAMVLPASAAEIKGVVIDPYGQPVAGAQVALITPAGAITRQLTDDQGGFDIYVSPLYESVQLRVSARGFQTVTTGMGAARIQLAPAPSGSAISGAISGNDLRDRNEAQAGDLIRETPGIQMAQAGARGPTAMSVRGSPDNYNQVFLDGIPVNSFYSGGNFDYARIASDFIEEIGIGTSPASAHPGAFSPGGTVDFVTRTPADGAAFDALAEGGTHGENRFALGGSGMILRDWGIAGSLSKLDTGEAYRNADAFLSTSYRWRTQNYFAFGNFDASDAAAVKTDASTLGGHWQDGITDNLRAEIITGYYVENFSGRDLRGYTEGRLTYAFLRNWSVTGGYAFNREETRMSEFALNRNDNGVYLETRYTQGPFSLNGGIREDIYQTLAGTTDKLSGKVSGSYRLDSTTTLHASYGSAIHAPGGLDYLLTGNPSFQPQRTESYDVGGEKRFLKNQVSIDASAFRNRYKTLGGTRGEGIDATARYRPAAWQWFMISGNYMWLESSLAPTALLDRAKQSASGMATAHYGKFDLNITGYFRGHELDSALVRIAGFTNLGINVNFRLKDNVTLYGNLRNALDRTYTEIPGYPALPLNFVAGVKWSLAKAR